MNIQSFIQSGLLEAYVLGQGSAEERTQVERMSTEHAEVRAELTSIEATLEGYAAAHAVQPPAWMKARILERIDQEKSTHLPPDATMPVNNRSALRLFQILAFLLAATSSFLFLRQKEMGRENDALKTRTDSLNQQLIACGQELIKPDPFAELVCHSATKRSVVSDGKGINTIVYYNALLKKIAYDPYNLPPLKEGKYYQFWAIVGEKPVNLGMKALGVCESIKTVENVKAFAISQEDKPDGNESPTDVLVSKPVI